MRQVAAVMILVALFAVLVGSRFKASDGEKLAAVSRLTVAKVRNAMPPTLNVTAPVDAPRPIAARTWLRCRNDRTWDRTTRAATGQDVAAIRAARMTSDGRA